MEQHLERCEINLEQCKVNLKLCKNIEQQLERCENHIWNRLNLGNKLADSPK